MKKSRLSIAILKNKILWVMTIFVLSQPIFSQTQKVSLVAKDVTIQEVFKMLEKQTSYTFLYKNELLANKSKVSLNFKEMPLNEVLKNILAPRNLTFELDDKVIVVRAIKDGAVNKPAIKKRLIVGIITDDENLPLPGTTITEKGSGNKAVISEIDGSFSIQVSSDINTVIVASFIGMKTKEVVVGDQPKIDIQLFPSSVLLSDFVVMGAYGTAQKRSDLVGSAYQVEAEKIKSLPTGRVDNLLDGMVPGLQITYNSDLSSSTKPRYNTRVRGQSSMSASSEPMWIVDGMPIYTGDKTNLVSGMNTAISPLSYINSEDIESITVLKDATSTSIYGANGANGVILITTKKGRSTGKPELSISARYGVAKINQSTRFKVLNAEQYMTLAKESWTNAGKDMKYFPFQDNSMNSYSTASTDWSDVYYSLGSTAQTNLTIRGGSENAKYYLSGAYYNNESTVKGNDQQRFSIRSNTDMRFNERIELSFNIASSYNINNIFVPGDDYYKILPIYTPYNADGSFRLYNTYVDGFNDDGSQKWSTSSFFNSVAEREENDNRQRTLATNVNVALKYDILKSLKFTSQFGIDYQGGFEDEYNARTNWSGMSSSEGAYGYSRRGSSTSITWTAIERLNFEKVYDIKHKVGAVFGFEANSSEHYNVSATGSGFVNDHIKEIGYAVDNTGTSNSSIVHTLSVLGQASYSYDSRYYLVLNARRDGNSDFGTDVRWANFGSAGISWNVHNEEFFNCDKINILKLKASLGNNGNSRLGTNQSMGLYTYGDSYNYMGNAGGAMSASPNPTLSWESTRMANIGLRIRLLDFLDLDMEAYNDKTTDLLSNLDVSRLTGDTRVYRNVGKISNKGFEATIGAELIKNNDFEWTVEANLSHNVNTLLELYNGNEKVMGEKIWREGYDVNTFYLVRWAGVDPRDGAPLWLDANGNLTRTYSYDNRVPYKSSSPDLTGGISSFLSYKQFSLNVISSYVIGGYAFSNFGRRVSSDGLNIMDENQSVNQLDRWQKPGDLALSPKPIWGVSTSSVMNSTRYLYNATYFLLRNVSLSYELHSDMLKKAGFSYVNLSLLGDNLGLWTPFDKKGRNSYRQSRSGYPMETSFSLGIECHF